MRQTRTDGESIDDESTDFVELPSEDIVDVSGSGRFRDAVVHSTDWTTETIVSQLRRGNIVLKPKFQRRDAWKIPQKTRFIESLILGLPIPQIVLAEAKNQRGRFIVLDGKQRLLSILQFWGLGEGENNAYALSASGLDIRKDLAKKTLVNIECDPELENDLNALLNQSIRTVVIRNWPSDDFLHLVFLRLNTGSVKLSPQELRQALMPGAFSEWIDAAAAKSEALKRLLKLTDPDYRMRDIEIVSRYLAFHFFLTEYRGRMKRFLDEAFLKFNSDWVTWEPRLELAMSEFELAVEALADVFGDRVGRKPGAKQFNRAIFDFLIFFAQDERVRVAMLKESDAVMKAFDGLFADPEFRSATERDTAGVPNTVFRLSRWSDALAAAIRQDLPTPSISDVGGEQRVVFRGF